MPAPTHLYNIYKMFFFSLSGCLRKKTWLSSKRIFMCYRIFESRNDTGHEPKSFHELKAREKMFTRITSTRKRHYGRNCREPNKQLADNSSDHAQEVIFSGTGTAPLQNLMPLLLVCLPGRIFQHQHQPSGSLRHHWLLQKHGMLGANKTATHRWYFDISQ